MRCAAGASDDVLLETMRDTWLEAHRPLQRAARAAARRGARAAQGRNVLHRRLDGERASSRTSMRRNRPAMVDVGAKAVTQRAAVAEARVRLPRAVGARAARQRPPHEEGPGVRHRHHRRRAWRPSARTSSSRSAIRWESRIARSRSSTTSSSEIVRALQRLGASPHRRRDGSADRRDDRGTHDLRHVQGAVARHRRSQACACSRRPAASGPFGAGRARAMNAPLYGLVLAGGRSTRMRADKAALSYAGHTQLERAVALLDAQLPRTFVSVRAEQAERPAARAFPADRRPPPEHRAHRRDPRRAGAAPGQRLAGARLRPAASGCGHAGAPAGRARPGGASPPPTAPATTACPSRCARSTSRPAGRSLSAYLAAGRNCPRKFLLTADATLLEEPNPRALDNINTPEEYAARAMSALKPESGRPPPKRSRVQYYALLREQAGPARGNGR